MCKISFTQKKGMILLKKWNIVIAEEFVRAYKLDDNSYLTDFEKNNLVYIFKKINTKTVVKQVKKSDYSKYFKRKTFIPSVVLQVELSENTSYINDYFFVLAENKNSYDEQLKKLNQNLENESIENIKTQSLISNINKNKNTLLDRLKNFNIENIEKSELENFNLFLINTLGKIESKEFNQEINTKIQIDKTIEGIQNKKKNKILELKKQIDLILSIKSKINITQLCEELKINRKTFYNLNLSEYIQEKFKEK